MQRARADEGHRCARIAACTSCTCTARCALRDSMRVNKERAPCADSSATPDHYELRRSRGFFVELVEVVPGQAGVVVVEESVHAHVCSRVLHVTETSSESFHLSDHACTVDSTASLDLHVAREFGLCSAVSCFMELRII